MVAEAVNGRARRAPGAGVDRVGEAVFERKEKDRQRATDEVAAGKRCAISVQQQTAAELTALATVVANWMILTPEARGQIRDITDRCLSQRHQ